MFEGWSFQQKGIILLVVVVLMSAIFAISLGIFRVVFGELLITGEISDSAFAFYTADEGIERTLYRDLVNEEEFCDPPATPCHNEIKVQAQSGGCYDLAMGKTRGKIQSDAFVPDPGGPIILTKVTSTGQYRCGASDIRVVKRAFDLTYLTVVPGPTAYRYLRMFIVDTNDPNWLGIGEIEYLVSGTEYPLSNMTSNNAPIPLVVTASNEYNPDFYGIYNAFNGVRSPSPPAGPLNEYPWYTCSGCVTNQWITIDLGPGNEINPTAVRVNNYGDTTAPKNFRFEGSNTGAFAGEEKVLGTFGPVTNWVGGDVKTFTFP